MDWEAAKKDLKRDLEETLQHTLTDGDLPAFAQAVSEDLVGAAAEGNAALVKEIQAQVKVRGEAMRLRSSARGWQLAANVVGLAGNLAVKAATESLVASADATTGPGNLPDPL